MHDAETLIAAIHRDWGEAQGNYDEFRFFTGLRPSEQIALVLSDIDLVQGIISVNKAQVSGVDRDKTKTSEDRRPIVPSRAIRSKTTSPSSRISRGRRGYRSPARLLRGDRRAPPVSAPSSAPMA